MSYLQKLKNKYIGDRAFYKMILSVAVPIMIQNGVTNLVNMLDNIMVGTVGNEAMGAVSIINQYTFVFNLLVFGAVSAAGIFTAQYFGNGDTEGVRNTFRLKFSMSVLSAVVCIIVFLSFDEELINLFLYDGSVEGNLELTMSYAKDYLVVIIIGLVPYALSQSYASTMRETGQTFVPMLSSVAAVVTNFILNSLLIFGLCGFPKLGIVGAGIATSISRFVELFVLIVFSIKNEKQRVFYKGIYKTLKVPVDLLAQVTKKGMPIMANEFFWSLSITMRNQCYSTRNLDVVGAINISSTISNVFNVIYIAMGAAIAIVIGNLLGEGKLEEAKDQDRKMIAFSILGSFAFCILLVSFASLFPQIYNTTDTVKQIATYMIIVFAFQMPVNAYINGAYFTLRSGGQVFVTILFDSVFMWFFVMPITYLATYLTDWNIYYLFAICQFAEALKAVFGLILMKKETWVRQIVGEKKTLQK